MEAEVAETAFRSANQALLVVDWNRRVLRANPALVDLTGTRLDDIIGAPGDALFVDPRSLVALLSTKGGYIELKGPSGANISAEAYVSKARVGGEDIFVLSIRSLERLKNDEAAITAMAKAESVRKAKTAFLETVSHELRTPMNGVLGMLEMLSGAELPSREAEIAKTAFSSASALLGTLNAILDAAKLEAGDAVIESRNFDAVSCVTQRAESFRPQVEADGVDLRVSVEPSLPRMVTGDPTRLGQITSAIVSNAFKFTDEGSIDVRVKGVRHGEGSFVRVEVADTGCGIAEDDLPDVFEGFGKVRHGHRATGGGLGLGLSTSHELVEAMGGRIGVSSQLGRGSTFWFELPLESDLPEAAGEAAEEAAPSRDGPLVILVAEDQIVNQKVMELFLNKLEHRFVVVENGKAAVEACRDREFDIVLMDIQMPEMDGVEATKAIRGTGNANAAIPIVAVTAHARPEDHELYIDAGMNAVIAKPVNMNVLSDAFLRHCAGAA